ncbi:MAG: sodium:calcium symporter, partial [Phycisphaerae bacterium]
AVTSSLSMLQPVIAFFEEGFGLKRHASVTILGLLSLMGAGFVVYFSAGMKALGTFDFWVGNFLIFFLAMIQCFMYGWIFGIKKGHVEAHHGAHIRIPWFVQLMIKYVSPLYLLAIFILFCTNNLPGSAKAIASDRVALSSIIFIGVIFVFMVIMIHIAGRRWVAEGRYTGVDDERPAFPVQPLEDSR